MDSLVHSYKDLIVWQKAMDLVVAIYELTNQLPKTETFGISAQIRRCSVSIPSNIAEGRRRSSQKDYRHFLIMAYGSGAELETQIEIIKRVYPFVNFNYNQIDGLLNEVMRMLNKITNTMAAD